jgi:hypothetical protein
MDIAAGGQPLDITVEARGLGEATSGEFQALTAGADVSPYSGRPFITRIDGGQFHLAAGQSKTVTVHFGIPATIGRDTHYAALAVTSKRTDTSGGTASVGSNVSILVPVVLTPAGAEMRRTGAIKSASALVARTGREVKLTAFVQNTGNRHYHAQAFITLYDSRGQVLAKLTPAPSATSLIPTFSQATKATYSLPATSPPMAPGEHYSAQILVQLEDGSWLPPFVIGWTLDRIYLPFVAYSAPGPAAALSLSGQPPATDGEALPQGASARTAPPGSAAASAGVRIGEQNGTSSAGNVAAAQEGFVGLAAEFIRPLTGDGQATAWVTALGGPGTGEAGLGKTIRGVSSQVWTGVGSFEDRVARETAVLASTDSPLYGPVGAALLASGFLIGCLAVSLLGGRSGKNARER